MGMFDEVRVPCPKCGVEYLAQSKGGACVGKRYSLRKAPIDVLSDVNRHAPFQCASCETMFNVSIIAIAAVPTVWNDTPRDDDNDD